MDGYVLHELFTKGSGIINLKNCVKAEIVYFKHEDCYSIIMDMNAAYERRRHHMTSSFFGWAHTQNDPLHANGQYVRVCIWRLLLDIGVLRWEHYAVISQGPGKISLHWVRSQNDFSLSRFEDDASIVMKLWSKLLLKLYNDGFTSPAKKNHLI